MPYTLNLDLEDFMANYWQKKPLLIKQGFVEFEDPIDESDLAALAQEDEADSRLVSHTDGTQWHVAHGPFDNFEHLGDSQWSLLVQGVDHWIPDAAELIRPFQFIPQWRIDDLMVSFSMPGGGVGPHLDQYDVFIVQGKGRRHWRVGAQQETQSHCPHPDLLQVKAFEAIIDAELEPGDILYIPPGCPHEGYANTPALNYSIGFRAPSERELFSGLADYLIDHDLGNRRFSDPSRATYGNHCGKVNESDIAQLKAMLQSIIDDESLLRASLLQQLSTPKRELSLDPIEGVLTNSDVIQFLEDGGELTWVSGVRRLYTLGTGLYVNGEKLDAGLAENDMELLADNTNLGLAQLKQASDLSLFAEVITTLTQQGLLFSMTE
ncbi:JmjC domain-containing protein [Corallincola platygyrae]|uniref:JmjC domain-containing protein n=1 Tax=Corallincola platygyrae TaxID=1193278 RepID=A0ABW4XJ42_9GAMM